MQSSRCSPQRYVTATLADLQGAAAASDENMPLFVVAGNLHWLLAASFIPERHMHRLQSAHCQLPQNLPSHLWYL